MVRPMMHSLDPQGDDDSDIMPEEEPGDEFSPTRDNWTAGAPPTFNEEAPDRETEKQHFIVSPSDSQGAGSSVPICLNDAILKTSGVSGVSYKSDASDALVQIDIAGTGIEDNQNRDDEVDLQDLIDKDGNDQMDHNTMEKPQRTDED